MCTVTYIPKEDGGFILTQNRDEDVKRSISTPPIFRKINGLKHLFPVDPQGRGTWIGISEDGRIASLLNGGSIPHKRKPFYKHSRGKVILDYFSYQSFSEFVKEYEFVGYEPFTLLIFENDKMLELVCNENDIQYKELNPKKPYMYSSTSLYPDSRITDRRLDFLEWYYSKSKISQEDILNYHKQLLFEDEPDKSKIIGDFILNTVSTTSIDLSEKSSVVLYQDYINDIYLTKNLKIKKADLALT